MAYTASKALTPAGSKAVKQLIDIGLIPAECTRFVLVLDAHKAIHAECEFLLSEEDVQKVADAFSNSPGEAAQVIKTAKAFAWCIGGKRDAGIPEFEL